MTNIPRVRRMIGDFDDDLRAPLTDGETTYFLPAGTENLAELDRWGRATRAYLFAGAECIGYKAKTGTVLYIKDHLGTTKVVMVQPKSTMADSSLITLLQDPPEPNGTVEDRTSYLAQLRHFFVSHYNTPCEAELSDGIQPRRSLGRGIPSFPRLISNSRHDCSER